MGQDEHQRDLEIAYGETEPADDEAPEHEGAPEPEPATQPDPDAAAD